MRIVGGRFKRTLLQVVSREGLRPTPERVRETLFDWLMHLTGGLAGAVVCDMFAGSGALGIEAVSRGAAKAYILEKDRRAAAGITATVQKISAQESVKIVATDSIVWMKNTLETFDAVFIDPPFAAGLHEAAARAAVEKLAPEGFLYLEHEREIDDTTLLGWGLKAVRRGRAGAVHYLLATRKSD